MMDRFAATCEAIAETSSRLGKVRLAADFLAALDDDSLGIAACILSGAPFSRVDLRRAQAGGALVRRVGADLTGWDEDTIRICSHATGDLSEALGLLSVGHVTPEPMSLTDARAVFDALAKTRVQARKHATLLPALRKLTPRGVKYFLKVLIGGLRIGLLEKQVEEAIALATGQAKEAVRAANVRSGDLESVARASRSGTLESVRANLFHPIDFMLASAVDTVDDVEDPARYLIEHKYDGIRAQAHVEGGRVALFSRGLGEVTAAFPEIASALKDLRGPLILDGELLAMYGDRALPFLVLQRRLARKAPSEALQREVPVSFVAYDLIHDESGVLFDLPLEDRQTRLRAALEPFTGERVRVSETHEVASREELSKLFESAREFGDEGLILKQRGSTYEPGRRGPAWLKLKRALGTLDVVITAVEQGHGQRATLLSDYTFAVRDGDRFVNVGKAYSGLTDEEIRALTRQLQSITIQKYGRVRTVRPEIVLEVAFDTVQLSTRHKSGFALRFPRILRWRTDKKPNEIDTVDRVREIYEHTINTGRISTERDVERPERATTNHGYEDLPLFAGLRVGTGHVGR